jgi:hypothetical protein
MRRYVLIALLSLGAVGGYATEAFSVDCGRSCHSRR